MGETRHQQLDQMDLMVFPAEEVRKKGAISDSKVVTIFYPGREL